MNIHNTIIESIMHNITLFFCNESIDVEPKRVLHTSPATLGDFENIFINI